MFNDSVGHWAERHINRVAELGVLRGYEDGSFGPERPVTRAEMATIIDRLLFGFHDLIESVEGALITVYSPWGLGSGTHIGNHLILTNHHVIAREIGPGQFEIPDVLHFHNTTDNPRTALPPLAGARARVIAASPEYDLAVLERTDYLHVRLPTIPLCRADHIRTGERVIAVGSPYGFDRTVTQGIVSHPDRVVDYYDDSSRTRARLIQVDAPINPGNSGGALINMAGHLLGVPSAGYVGADGLGFAIRIDSVREWLTAHGIPFEDGHAA